jgi:hypothetical protein
VVRGGAGWAAHLLRGDLAGTKQRELAEQVVVHGVEGGGPAHCIEMGAPRSSYMLDAQHSARARSPCTEQLSIAPAATEKDRASRCTDASRRGRAAMCLHAS